MKIYLPMRVSNKEKKKPEKNQFVVKFAEDGSVAVLRINANGNS